MFIVLFWCIAWLRIRMMIYALNSNVAPHLTGFWLKFFVKILETPLIGSLVISHLKKENKMIEVCVLGCVVLHFVVPILVIVWAEKFILLF